MWDDPAVDWAAYDLVVLRSPWDYVSRRDEFVAWAAGVPRLANPADVVAWNTDKRYLASWPPPACPWCRPPGWAAADRGSRRPAGSTSSSRPSAPAAWTPAGTTWPTRSTASSPPQHVDRLRAAGRLVMVQPYLTAVDTYGETALMYVGGWSGSARVGRGRAGLPDGPGGLVFSHGIRKGPMLTGPDQPDADLYRPEEITPRVPIDAEHAVAQQALAAVPGGADRLLYARVDLIPGPDLAPLLVELELTEPSLFLGTAPGAADRFADAIVDRLTPR